MYIEVRMIVLTDLRNTCTNKKKDVTNNGNIHQIPRLQINNLALDLNLSTASERCEDTIVLRLFGLLGSS